MDKVLDVRGLPCPQPVIKAKQELKNMAGGRLQVLADDEISVQNLMKFGKFSGLEATSEKRGEKEFMVTFQVEGGEKPLAAQAMAAEAPSCQPDGRQKGTVVVVSSEFMGEGDQVLGKLLMKGFLYALAQLDDLPETLLLYNGGAKLSVEGSDSLEDLRTLEAQGVEILTCGTCLNYYGLAKQLAVGEVTNMYAIAEILAGARSIIKP